MDVKVKIKLLESSKVYDINNLKANPIFELATGTEIEVQNVLKAWKAWYKLTLPDGRIGLISSLTKAQVLGSVVPKAGGWSNFIRVLESDNAEQLGYDLLECIKEYEREIIMHIQTDKDPEAVILRCSRSGADWLLKKEVVNDDVIQLLRTKSSQLLTKSSTLNKYPLPIFALAEIEKAQKEQYVDNNLIELLVEKAKSDELYTRSSSISALEAIECARKNGVLIPIIIDACRVHGENCSITLWKSSQDDRIIDFFIEQLDRNFLEIDSLKSSIVHTVFYPGAALVAAEILLMTGKERGIREIFPHIMEYVKNGDSRVKDEMAKWCIKHSSILIEYLIIEFLKLDINSFEAYMFVAKCIPEIADIDAKELTVLENSSDPGVRRYAENLRIKLTRR